MSAHSHTVPTYEMPKYSLGQHASFKIGIGAITEGFVMGMELTQSAGVLRYSVQDSRGMRHWVYADEMIGSVRYLGIHNEGHDDDNE